MIQFTNKMIIRVDTIGVQNDLVTVTRNISNFVEPSEAVFRTISDCTAFNSLIYFVHVHFPECVAFNAMIYIVHVHFPEFVAFKTLI